METKAETKPLDAYELIKLTADTIEFLGRMHHFYATVLQPKYVWLVHMNPYIETSLPFDGGLRIDYVVEEDLWQILCSRKVGAITDLSAAKARILQGFAHGIKLDYYVCVGLDGQFEPNLHPPYTEGMSGKLYLTEVATAYQKALLKYAEDN